MAWIKTIEYKQATGKLKKLYDRVKGPNGKIDNILKVHSLRPHTLEGHMVLYKNVLHNSGNTLPKWFLEAVGVYVSMLNRCDYCVEHHYAGLKRLLNDDKRAAEMRNAFEKDAKIIKSKETDPLKAAFKDKEHSLMTYAFLLTRMPSKINKIIFKEMKKKGITDGVLLEVNQVVSYFNYANRTVLGLGVDLKSDTLGLSPGDSDDPDNWNHD